jgi:hypothetical protein
VPFLVEVLGYLGTALAGAAGAVFLARIWNDLALAGRLVIPALGSVVFLGAGSFVARGEDPVAQRLAGFLWLLGAAATGWFAATLSADAADASERVTTLAVGCSVALVGAGLLAYRQWPVSQLVLAVGLVIALAGAFAEAELGFAIAWTLLGVAWTGAGVRRLLPPARTALLIGTLLAVLGPAPAMEAWTGAATIAGAAIAAGVVALGAWQRHGQVLAVGVVGVFLYLVRAITYFLRGSGATALALLTIGLALIAIAVVAMRSRPRPGPPRPAHG